MYEFSKKELDALILFLDSVLIPDSKYSKTLQKSISESKNNNLSDEKIKAFASKNQNLRDSIYLMDKHISNFQGILCEKVEMFIYNYLKNSSDVITITNPESQSKADLIHIIDKNKYSFSSCGPDVKYGELGYVVDEYIEKHLSREESFGFIDVSSYLNPKDYKEGIGFKNLTKRQNKKILEAVSKYGYKPATMPLISRIQYQQICAYYLKYISTGELPSKLNKEDFYDFYIKMVNNNLRTSDILNNLHIIQNEIKISEIKDLMEIIKNPPTLDSNNKKSNASNFNSKNDYHYNSDVNATSKLKGFFKNPKVLVGGAVAIGSIIATVHPKSRRYIVDLIKKGTSKIMDTKPTTDASSKSKIDLIKRGTTLATFKKAIFNSNTMNATSELIGKVDVKQLAFIALKQVEADNKSAFLPALQMFSDGLISKEEFFEIASEISNRTGKSVYRYLQLLVNFHKNTVAESLLK